MSVPRFVALSVGSVISRWFLGPLNRCSINISASRAREDLLGSVQRDIDEYKGLRGGKQEMYAREREHLINSDRLADQAIEIAR